jgi:hypothetical protein
MLFADFTLIAFFIFVRRHPVTIMVRLSRQKFGRKFVSQIFLSYFVTLPVQNMSTADEIMKFKKLLDDGIITKEEFEEQKRKLLK